MKHTWITTLSLLALLVSCGGDEGLTGPTDGSTDTVLTELPDNDIGTTAICDALSEGQGCDDGDACSI